MYYLGWMSCLISFERYLSSWEEHGASEHYKKILSTVEFEPRKRRRGLRLQVDRPYHSANSPTLRMKELNLN